MNKPIAFLAGYSGQRPSVLLARAEELNALVLDVRFKPRSKQSGWNEYELLRSFPVRRYAWWGHWWGNKNFATGSGFDLPDYEKGLEILEAKLARIPYDSIILLCACRGETECHRGYLGKLLREAGYTVRPLVWHPKPVVEPAQKELVLL
jgi:hypothetical protein